MWITIVIALLTIAVIACIFGGTLIAWSKHPPVMRFDIVIPPEFKLVLQNLPANIETDKPTEVPIPASIVEYISFESDIWAQDARKKRARALYADTKNWDVVLRQLELEDNGLERP